VPKLSVILAKFREGIQELEHERARLEKRLADIQREQAEIESREGNIQRLLAETGEKFERLRKEAEGRGSEDGFQREVNSLSETPVL